jgi:hypothetical protein
VADRDMPPRGENRLRNSRSKLCEKVPDFLGSSDSGKPIGFAFPDLSGQRPAQYKFRCIDGAALCSSEHHYRKKLSISRIFRYGVW